MVSDWIIKPVNFPFHCLQARKSLREGNVDAARNHAQYALCCNVISAVFAVLAYLGLVIAVSVNRIINA